MSLSRLIAHLFSPPTARIRLLWIWPASSLSALLIACGQSAPPAVGAGPATMPPPAEVGVVTVTLADVGLVTELPGRLEASRVAQVRARVAGILQKRLFVEGSDVKRGQALFTVDASPYEAALTGALANVAKAEANVMQTTAQADRFKLLLEAKAISQLGWVNTLAAQKLAQADLAVAQAGVQTARINVSYAHITAPIAGRIGRALVTEGALVGQAEATQLAVIQQINPIYVNFTQSAAEVMRLRQALDTGQLMRAGSQAASVRVVLEDGTEFDKPGKLLFSDLTVDATSGQITLRAEVPNPQGTLLPGLFVRVRLAQAQASNAMTLPQQAVTRSPQGDSVMVVTSDGKVAPRPIQLGGQQRGQWVVLGGLQTGEQVMVDGFQKLRPGARVKPVPWQDIRREGTAPTKTEPAASAAK